MQKSISELNEEIGALVMGRDRTKVENLLRKWYRVGTFSKLNWEQLSEVPAKLQDAIYKGEI
jgi:hypothetical protein